MTPTHGVDVPEPFETAEIQHVAEANEGIGPGSRRAIQFQGVTWGDTGLPTGYDFARTDPGLTGQALVVAQTHVRFEMIRLVKILQTRLHHNDAGATTAGLTTKGDAQFFARRQNGFPLLQILKLSINRNACHDTTRIPVASLPAAASATGGWIVPHRNG